MVALHGVCNRYSLDGPLHYLPVVALTSCMIGNDLTVAVYSILADETSCVAHKEFLTLVFFDILVHCMSERLHAPATFGCQEMYTWHCQDTLPFA